MTRKRYMLLCICIAFAISMQGSGIYSKQDSLIYISYIKAFASKKQLPTSDLIVHTAMYFLDKPYVASTLERGAKESLVVNLQAFDCTTFVESCIALAKTVQSPAHSFLNYKQQLTKLRYRNGDIDGYTSRLHYVSDWIYENERAGLLKNITEELGGTFVNKPINFMSQHPQLYKQLRTDNINITKTKKIEDSINNRQTYCVIFAERVSIIEKNIKDGDIIVFATAIKGLDYSHIGFAYWIDNELHFIHASSLAKETIVEKKRLADYCLRTKSCTGITVLRINNI